MSAGGPTTPILSKPKKFNGRRTKKKRFPDRFVHGRCTGFTHTTADEQGGITSTNHPTCRIAGTCYGFARYGTSFSNQRRNETWTWLEGWMPAVSAQKQQTSNAPAYAPNIIHKRTVCSKVWFLSRYNNSIEIHFFLLFLEQILLVSSPWLFASRDGPKGLIVARKNQNSNMTSGVRQKYFFPLLVSFVC